MVKTKVYPFELIGERIKIIDSENQTLLNMEGIIVDETKNLFKLKLGSQIKTVLKNVIKFKLLSNGIIIDGKKIVKRPEERLKGK
jgi:ribonuclease P protein subunit POP4